AGRLGRAINELRGLHRITRTPELQLAVDCQLADVLRAKEQRTQAEAVLAPLLENPKLSAARPSILLRLAHLAQDRYQYPRARELYDEITAIYPASDEG